MGIHDIVTVAYSYKGGSGRTTAAVNLAGALVAAGQRVVCIDMDLGSPGMRILLGASLFKERVDSYLQSGAGGASPLESGAELDEHGIHEFLDRKIDDPDGFVEQCGCDFWSLKEAPFRNGADDDSPEGRRDRRQRALPRVAEYLERFNNGRDVFYAPERFWSGELLFIPGSLHERRVALIKESRRLFRQRLDDLQEAVRRYFRRKDPSMPDDAIVYYVLDSASGVNENSLPVLRLSDILLVFFRWSLQHYYGSKNNVGVLDIWLRDERSLGTRIFSIGNCAPLKEQLRSYVASAHRDFTRFGMWFDYERRRLAQTPEDWQGLEYIGDIYEEPLLKFSESLAYLEAIGRGEGMGTELAEGQTDPHEENVRALHRMANRLIREGHRIRDERLRRKRLRASRS